MGQNIVISKRTTKKGDDGHKIVSVRMTKELVEQLDKLSIDTNRSRNELINTLLGSAIEIVKIE